MPPDPRIWDIAEFPFTSISSLWSCQDYDTPHNGLHVEHFDQAQWDAMVEEYTGATVSCSYGTLFLYSKTSRRRISLSGCETSNKDSDNRNTPRVAWALSPYHPYSPWAVCAQMQTIWIYDCAERRCIGRLRGHGDAITSLTVHPTFPHILCSTSRDFFARIYDLTLEVDDLLPNEVWPSTPGPSQAGAAFGLRMAGMDGKGFGRCVTILAGGRSGGSKADVLGASFHPRLPLIATCNMDRTCKIWHLAMLIDHQPTLLRRPDKPLFSSSNIHAGRVVSIYWVTDDVLLSISAPTPVFGEDMYIAEDFVDDQSKYLKGTVVMWKWLSFERYMGQKGTYKDIASPNFHGLVTDFQESESFTMLAASQLPHDVFYASPRVQFIKEGKSRWLLYCLPGHSQTVWCIGLENIHRCFEEGSRSDEGLKMVEAMTIQTDMDLFMAYFLESTKDIIVTDRGGDIHRWGIDEQPRQA